MAEQSRRQVALSAAAIESLREIWQWNAEHYGLRHADAYLDDLQAAVDSLAKPKVVGRPVDGRPKLRYLLIRRRSGGHGHLAVFQVVGNRVTVLRLFHTAQDWQSSLSADTPG
jgi:plasmid stabilization system protein ParE